MGLWHLSISGAGSAADADALTKTLLATARKAGHTIHATILTTGSPDTSVHSMAAPTLPGAKDKPADG